MERGVDIVRVNIERYAPIRPERVNPPLGKP
jgi:hypothetical protein